MSTRYIEDVLPLGELNKYAQRGGGVASLNAMRLYFTRRPLTASRAVPLVDILHAAYLLWGADRREELSGPAATRNGELWPVAQPIVEPLPRDNAERKAWLSLLGTRVDLESCALCRVEGQAARAGSVEVVGAGQ